MPGFGDAKARDTLKHNIPSTTSHIQNNFIELLLTLVPCSAVPQPHKRDSLLSKVRANYDTVAKKASDSIAYPGDWLYETWTESDLKEWLDERGYPVPQPTTRDQLIASVRRNSRLASLHANDLAASASKSAQAATQTLSDQLIDSWSDTKLKEFLDKNNIKVPQVSNSRLSTSTQTN